MATRPTSTGASQKEATSERDGMRALQITESVSLQVTGRDQSSEPAHLPLALVQLGCHSSFCRACTVGSHSCHSCAKHNRSRRAQNTPVHRTSLPVCHCPSMACQSLQLAATLQRPGMTAKHRDRGGVMAGHSITRAVFFII